MTSKPKSTLRNIQALRAIAAVMVIFVHLDVLLRLMGGVGFGAGGVDIFFVISGLIMVTVTARGERPPLEFLIERLARIAPLYWLLTLTVFAIAVIAPALLDETEADPARLLKSLAFLPYERDDGTLRPVLFVGWTLNYEMFFYGLFALGLALPSRRAGIFAVVAALALLVALGAFVDRGHALTYFYTRPVLAEFGMGMLLGRYAGRLPVLEGAFAKAGVLALAVLMLAVIVAGPLAAPDLNGVPFRGPAALILVAAALVLERSGWAIGFPPVLALGDASYALYLTHPFVTQAVVAGTRKLHAEAWAPAGVLAALVVSCGGAVLVHRLVEAPLLEWTRRRTPRSAANPVRRGVLVLTSSA
jgi:peptidoglycan/LPS O-acetylase OafA/YrhL